MTKFENAQGYINVLCDIFDKYGLPAEIRIDRIRLLESHVPGSVTQIWAQLEKMGITVIAKSHPTNKPVIENSWNSWQQSLPIFLSINIITTVEAYNKNREKVLEYMNSLNKKTPMIITEKKKFTWWLSWCVNRYNSCLPQQHCFHIGWNIRILRRERR